MKVNTDLENNDKNHVKILEDKPVNTEADIFKHSEQFEKAIGIAYQ